MVIQDLYYKIPITEQRSAAQGDVPLMQLPAMQ